MSRANMSLDFKINVLQVVLKIQNIEVQVRSKGH